MDLSAIIQILNTGIPAGIISKVVADKIKAMFNGKEVTEEKLKQLIVENDDLKETLEDLQKELTKNKTVINTQINDAKFEHTTFNYYN